MPSQDRTDESRFALDEEIDGAGETLILTDLQAAKLCDVFSDALGSGLSYERIFDMMERHKLGSDLIDHFRDALQNRGLRLSETFRRHRILDDSAHRLLTAAEFQGRLPQTFEELSELYRQRQENKRQIMYALVEPLIIIALVSFVLIRGILPNLNAFLFADDIWAHLIEVVTGVLVETGIFGAFWIGLFWTWFNLPVNMRLRAQTRRLWTRIPVVSRSSQLHAVSLFCSYFKQSIESGLDIYRSMRLAARACNDARIAKGVDRAAEKIKEGSSLTDALFDVKALPDEVIEQIDIGEESGRLAERLDNLADRFYQYSQERFAVQMTVLNHVVRYGSIILALGFFFWSILGTRSMIM